MTHKGIHHRGYLPHWDFAESVQAVTFRLADSLPSKVIGEWRIELRGSLQSPVTEISRKAEADLHRRIARYEDAGHGACLFAKPNHAEIVQNSLIDNHGSTYKLIDWCVMPNHVHVLFRMMNDTSLGNIIKLWKAASAIQINRLNGMTGSLWMADYHDCFIRDPDHFQNARAYVRNNPVKAGLCEKPEDWAHSSAGINWSAEPGICDSRSSEKPRSAPRLASGQFIPPENKEAAE